MGFETKTKMEDIARDAGCNVALEWSGDSVDEFLEVLGIANDWNERELAAFKAGFDETRDEWDDYSDDEDVSEWESDADRPKSDERSCPGK